MRTEKCESCRNYTEEKDRSGREWMNATGWCDLPRLHTKRRRIDKDNWCDQYVEGDAKSEPSPAIQATLDAIIEEQQPDESFGSETSKSFEHWKLAVREKLADIKKLLDELDELINTPYEDLE